MALVSRKPGARKLFFRARWSFHRKGLGINAHIYREREMERVIFVCFTLASSYGSFYFVSKKGVLREGTLTIFLFKRLQGKWENGEGGKWEQ